MYVEENVGVACLPVSRSQGTFGTVGAQFTVESISASGGGVDYSPDSGDFEVEPMIDSGCVDITIVNDFEPEIAEV